MDQQNTVGAWRQSLLCLTQRNAQTCQPEELKHGILLVRKCKISCHPGEYLDFVTSFQVSEKTSISEIILCKTFNVKIKDILFTDGLSSSFSKSWLRKSWHILRSHVKIFLTLLIWPLTDQCFSGGTSEWLISETEGQTLQHPEMPLLHNSWGKKKNKASPGTHGISSAPSCEPHSTHHSRPSSYCSLPMTCFCLSYSSPHWLPPQTFFSKLSLRKLQAFFRDLSFSADLPPFPGTTLELSIWSHCLIS